MNEVVENAFDIQLVFGAILSSTKIHYIFQVAVLLWWSKNVLESYWGLDDPRSFSQFDGWEIKPCYDDLACVSN